MGLQINANALDQQLPATPGIFDMHGHFPPLQKAKGYKAVTPADELGFDHMRVDHKRSLTKMEMIFLLYLF